jgi:hypothetical protein
MFEELSKRVDEMYGATLLTGVALYSMHMGIDGGIVELCIGGVIALLVTKAVKGGA